MSNTLRIKKRYDISANIKGRQAIASLIRSHVDGGNELLDALTRLSEYLHNSQPRPERGSLEAVKTALDEARAHLGDIFMAADDAAEGAANALEILISLRQRLGSLDPVLQDIHDWLETACAKMDAPLRLTARQAASDEAERQGKKRPSSHDWSKVDFGRPSADIAAEMGVSIQAVNKQRRKLAPNLPRASTRAPKRR